MSMSPPEKRKPAKTAHGAALGDKTAAASQPACYDNSLIVSGET